MWIKIRFKLLRFFFNGQQFWIVLVSFVVWLRSSRVKKNIKLITFNKFLKSFRFFKISKYFGVFLVLFRASNKYHFYGYSYQFVLYIDLTLKAVNSKTHETREEKKLRKNYHKFWIYLLYISFWFCSNERNKKLKETCRRCISMKSWSYLRVICC